MDLTAGAKPEIIEGAEAFASGLTSKGHCHWFHWRGGVVGTIRTGQQFWASVSPAPLYDSEQ